MSEQTRWVQTIADEDLRQGDLIDVEIDGECVLLVRLLNGLVKAYQATCPHQGTLLSDGDWDADDSTLVCPSHLWEFDLSDGRGINPSRAKLREYCVRSNGKWLDIEIPTT